VLDGCEVIAGWVVYWPAFFAFGGVVVQKSTQAQCGIRRARKITYVFYCEVKIQFFS